MRKRKSLSNEQDLLNLNDSDIDAIIKDVVKPVKQKHGKKNEHYVNPIELDADITKFYENGIMDCKLGEQITKIATRLSFCPNFINYTYKEEMIGDAIVKMIRALENKKYDHAKGYNPFSYFTKIAFNAFRNRIKKEKRQREALMSYQEEVYQSIAQQDQIYTKPCRSSDEAYDSFED